jgi:hypothetical protein
VSDSAYICSKGRFVKVVSMSVYGAVGALVYGVLAFAIVALAAYVFV